MQYACYINKNQISIILEHFTANVPIKTEKGIIATTQTGELKYKKKKISGLWRAIHDVGGRKRQNSKFRLPALSSHH